MARSLADAHLGVLEVRIEDFDNRILVGGPAGFGWTREQWFLRARGRLADRPPPDRSLGPSTWL